jgi:hypothetical protein
VIPDDNLFRVTANPGKPTPHHHHKYNESSESDISSLSEDSEEPELQARIRIVQDKNTIEVG